MQLLYLWKLSYQQKKFKIIKISQEDVILIKNLYLSRQCGARRALRELPDKGGKLGSIDSLLKRSHKTGTIVWKPGSGRPHSSRSSGGPCAQSRGQAKNASVILLDFAWNCHSLFKCTQKKFTVISGSHASNDVVLSCCLKPIISPVSLADKQPLSAINVVIVLL